MDNIIEIEKDVYLVNGVMIKAENAGMFRGDDRDDLIKLADGFREECPGPCGPRTIFGIGLVSDPELDGAKYEYITVHSFESLSSHAKKIVDSMFSA